MSKHSKAQAAYNKAVAPARVDYAKAMKAFSEARACEMSEIAYDKATAAAQAAFYAAIAKALEAGES